MKKIIFIICYLFIITANYAVDVENSSKKLFDKAQFIENKILKIYDDLIKYTVRLPNGGCGVLISKDGYILTAGHIFVEPGLEISVYLHDGSQYTATTLGKDEKGDYGLLKIKEKRNWKYAALGSSENLEKNECCLMFGHPGGFQTGRPAVVRIGFVKDIHHEGFLQTTCIMIPGDSGGPLFSMEGKVIGINSRIDEDIEENLFVAIDKIKKNWERLVKGELFNKDVGNHGMSFSYSDFRSHNESEEEPKTSQNPFVLENGKEGLIEAIKPNVKKISKSVVDISSYLDGNEINVYGSIVNSNGLIISKSSRVGDSAICCELDNGKKIIAELIGRNRANDLVLLKIKTNAVLCPIDLKKKIKVQSGQLLGSVKNHGEVIYSGILGVQARKIKYIKARASGYIGLRLSKEEYSIIKKVYQGKAADKAGLMKGDKIIKIDNTFVTKRKELIAFLKQTSSGQKITVKIIRNTNDEKVFKVKLGKSSPKKTFVQDEHPAYANIAINKRSDGFQSAFRHDMPLQLDECGTPVVTLKGEVIGINIARTDRTASFAIPLVKVAEVVQQISKEAAK
jgi:serine protease Do